MNSSSGKFDFNAFSSSRYLLNWALATILFVILSSCQKEETLISGKSAMSKAENPHAWYLRYMASKPGQVTPRGDMLTVSQALEYLNDGMNFLYCRPDDQYQETVLAADTFSVTLTSGEVDEDDLINMMDDIAIFAGTIYHADGRSDKEPVMFDINLLSSTSTSASFQAIFHYAGGLPHSTDDAYPYQDSWLFGEFSLDASGYCSNEGVDVDAADLYRRDLRKELMHRNKLESYYFKDPYYACFHILVCGATEIPEKYLLVPLDEEYNVAFLDNPNDITEQDNLYDQLLFGNYSGFQNYNECLSVNEMNFFYEEMNELAADVLPSPSGNYVISNIEVGYERILLDFETAIGHSMLVVRSTKTTITDEEHMDPIQLPD